MGYEKDYYDDELSERNLEVGYGANNNEEEQKSAYGIKEFFNTLQNIGKLEMVGEDINEALENFLKYNKEILKNLDVNTIPNNLSENIKNKVIEMKQRAEELVEKEVDDEER